MRLNPKSVNRHVLAIVDIFMEGLLTASNPHFFEYRIIKQKRYILGKQFAQIKSNQK